MQIEIEYNTYDRIKKVADLLNESISTILFNPISDGMLEEYYKEEIEIEENHKNSIY